MKDWWKDYFDEAWLQMVSHVKRTDETIAEASFIAQQATLYNCHRILDVPCSTGRIALQLAKQGFALTALDYNQRVLELGQKNDRRKKVVWQQGDMRDMPFTAQFEMVVCVFGSFGYFSAADNLRFLQSAAKALVQGGRLILETHTYETLLPVFTDRGFWRFDECIILEEREFDPMTAKVTSNWVVIKDGKQHKTQSQLHIYTLRELCQLLADSGFDDMNFYSSYDATPYSFGDDMLLINARKK